HIRYIDTGFDDCRTYEHVELSRKKSKHDIFQLIFIHLSVRNSYTGISNQASYFPGNTFDILHAIIQEKYLPTPCHLTFNRFTHEYRVVFKYVRLNRKTIFRRGFDDR